MKKWMVFVLVACVATMIQAGEDDKGITKKEYVKNNLQYSKKNLKWNPTKAELEDLFEANDTDGDGLLSPAEQQAAKEKKAKGKSKKSGKGSKGVTKQEYVKNNLQSSKKKPHWNPTKADLEKMFDERDTNGDGLLSPAEQQAGKKKK